MPHFRDLPLPPGSKILDSELRCLWLVSEEEVVVCFDPAHSSTGLDGSVVEDDAVVREAEVGTARHVGSV